MFRVPTVLLRVPSAVPPMAPVGARRHPEHGNKCWNWLNTCPGSLTGTSLAPILAIVTTVEHMGSHTVSICTTFFGSCTYPKWKPPATRTCTQWLSGPLSTLRSAAGRTGPRTQILSLFTEHAPYATCYRRYVRLDGQILLVHGD